MKETNPKKATYCLIPSIRYSEKRQDFGDSKRISGCQEWCGEDKKIAEGF
jgi:hypothetical protein